MASTMYLKFENPEIAGSAKAPGHNGEIEVLSWSNGFVQPTGPSFGPVDSGGRHQNLTFSKYQDSATDELLKLSWGGKQIGKGILTCYREGSSTAYLTVIMTHVIIANINLTGGPRDVPVENVALDYGLIDYRYKEQKQNNRASS